MSRTGLKKMLVAGVAILGCGCVPPRRTPGGGGALPRLATVAAMAAGIAVRHCTAPDVPCCGCYSGWCGCGRHHRACRWGCGYGCGWSCGCDPCCDVSCCGTSVGYWGSPVVSSCGCGGAPVVAPAEGSSMPIAGQRAGAGSRSQAGAAPASPSTTCSASGSALRPPCRTARGSPQADKFAAPVPARSPVPALGIPDRGAARWRRHQADTAATHLRRADGRPTAEFSPFGCPTRPR